MEQNQTNAQFAQNTKPQLDASNFKEKEEKGIWTWRFDETANAVVLDVKEFTNSGIETGNVHSYTFEEMQLDRINNDYKARMLTLDAQILQISNELLNLKEKKILEEKRFEKEFAGISEGVKRTLEQAKKKK